MNPLETVYKIPKASKTVDEIKSHHIEINTFTVNDEASVKQLRDYGVDCVIGNFPDMVKRVLEGD